MFVKVSSDVRMQTHFDIVYQIIVLKFKSLGVNFINLAS